MKFEELSFPIEKSHVPRTEIIFIISFPG